MKEIGGYLAFPTYRQKMLYSDGILLNSCRNCLDYLIKINNIKEIYLPYYICDVIDNICTSNNVKIIKYHIDKNFVPIVNEIKPNSYLLIVNWFGQVSKKWFNQLKKQFKLIIDNTQCYFNKPISGTFTMYSCRKFFGVPDGGILFGNVDRELYNTLHKSISYNHMSHLTGRFEKSANEFYNKFLENEQRINNEETLQMSLLTQNILNSIDYKKDKNIRQHNFKMYHKYLSELNDLDIKYLNGTFAYPFFNRNAQKIKDRLLKEKIYIPTLWPNCLNLDSSTIEYKYAEQILALPCNTECTQLDINKIINIIKEELL